jgi:hypothetical protein
MKNRFLFVMPMLVAAAIIILMPFLCAQEYQPVRNVVKAIVPPVVKQVVTPQRVCNSATGTCSVLESRQSFVPTQSYTVVSSVPSYTVVSSSVVETQSVADNVIFRRVLLKAASNQRRAGNISIEDYLVIARSARNPAKLQELRDALQDAAVEEGLATATAINWEGIADFIERLLPIILKLIELFGYNAADVQGLCFLSNTSVQVMMNDGFSFTLGA